MQLLKLARPLFLLGFWRRSPAFAQQTSSNSTFSPATASIDSVVPAAMRQKFAEQPKSELRNNPVLTTALTGNNVFSEPVAQALASSFASFLASHTVTQSSTTTPLTVVVPIPTTTSAALVKVTAMTSPDIGRAASSGMGHVTPLVMTSLSSGSMNGIARLVSSKLLVETPVIPTKTSLLPVEAASNLEAGIGTAISMIPSLATPIPRIGNDVAKTSANEIGVTTGIGGVVIPIETPVTMATPPRPKLASGVAKMSANGGGATSGIEGDVLSGTGIIPHIAKATPTSLEHANDVAKPNANGNGLKTPTEGVIIPSQPPLATATTPIAEPQSASAEPKGSKSSTRFQSAASSDTGIVPSVPIATPVTLELASGVAKTSVSLGGGGGGDTNASQNAPLAFTGEAAVKLGGWATWRFGCGLLVWGMGMTYYA